jgi:hypothetical protein
VIRFSKEHWLLRGPTTSMASETPWKPPHELGHVALGHKVGLDGEEILARGPAQGYDDTELNPNQIKNVPNLSPYFPLYPVTEIIKNLFHTLTPSPVST